MSAALITGSAGAGKSAVAAVLARRGLACIDDGEDPFLARFVDSSGAVVTEEPADPDLAWLARHRWEWDPARLDELIRAAAPATLYLCGGADNELEPADRFTQVFVLEIDEPTMLARLDMRQGNEWGRAGDSREYIRRLRPVYQDRLRAFGAIPIDARQPIDQVVAAILSTVASLSQARTDPALLRRTRSRDMNIKAAVTGHTAMRALAGMFTFADLAADSVRAPIIQNGIEERKRRQWT